MQSDERKVACPNAAQSDRVGNLVPFQDRRLVFDVSELNEADASLPVKPTPSSKGASPSVGPCNFKGCFSRIVVGVPQKNSYRELLKSATPDISSAAYRPLQATIDILAATTPASIGSTRAEAMVDFASTEP